jgi:hypothetical protein
MTKKNEYKPDCILIHIDTWNILKKHYGNTGIKGYLIRKVNVGRVTYSVHVVNGMNTLENNKDMVNLCLGDQMLDSITMKCDDDAVSFFVDNHGKFLFWINHEKGIIRNNSVGFEELDWADENGHLQSFLNDLRGDKSG